MFSWEYFCSLFPSSSSEDIDPKQFKCKCGYTWHFSKWRILWMVFHNQYVFTCPQCQRKSTFTMIYHIARDIDSEEVKEHNRWFDG